MVPQTKKFLNPFGFTAPAEAEKLEKRANTSRVNPFASAPEADGLHGADGRKGRGRPPKQAEPEATKAEAPRKREVKAALKGYAKAVENPESPPTAYTSKLGGSKVVPDSKPKKFQKRDRSGPRPTQPAQRTASLIRSSPPGNPFPSVLPQSSKYAAMFTFNQAAPGFNPFLKKKMTKTLCATPSKFEIRQDAPTIRIKDEKEAKVEKRSSKLSKPSKTPRTQRAAASSEPPKAASGIREKLKKAKLDKPKSPKVPKVSKASRKISKDQVQDLLRKKAQKEAKRQKKQVLGERLKKLREKKRQQRQERVAKIEERKAKVKAKKAAKRAAMQAKVGKLKQIAKKKKMQEKLRK